ncbi:YdgA family protein [Wielerella bovis]|uniref:YdgA family protein n=1 Tax=Wielerella bovis TaxID=2917790 RepID=UPI00201A14FB|nr:YdgA family protein [Wielerella bovis]ULJ60928.1 YdgA family protein [Wielerella bovis]
MNIRLKILRQPENMFFRLPYDMIMPIYMYFYTVYPMKKILLGGATAAVVAVAALGSPYYLGSKARQSLQQQHDILADTFFIEIDKTKSNYQQGWFSSTETIVFRFSPNVLANLSKQIPNNVRVVLEKPITLVNHVKHHPFAAGITPVRAVVDTEFQYDPEVKKTLARFFGEQTPLTVRNIIKFNGDGDMSVKVAPFDYEELSGIKLNWNGLDGTVSYQNGYAQYTTHFVMPAFKAQLADKGSLNFEQLDLSSTTESSQDGKTALGSSNTTLGKFEATWQAGIDYHIHLNELINMVTDLQIGAFINPNGTVPPSSIRVENLSYATQTQEPEAGFINTQGKFAFAKLHYGDKQYGPLNIDVVAEHLHTDSLNALKTKWQALANEPVVASDASSPAVVEEQNQKWLAAVRNEGAGVFTNNPVFKVQAFDFTTPQGHIKAKGSLKFTDLTQADLNDSKLLIAKMNADLELDVSQSLIEDFSITQTSHFFTTEDPNNAQEQQEIRDTIKLLINQSIDSMAQEGYLSKDNGAVKTHLLVANNQITLNNKPFQTQTNEDLFANLEDENAVPPQPESASAP